MKKDLLYPDGSYMTIPVYMFSFMRLLEDGMCFFPLLAVTAACTAPSDCLPLPLNLQASCK